MLPEFRKEKLLVMGRQEDVTATRLPITSPDQVLPVCEAGEVSFLSKD